MSVNRLRLLPLILVALVAACTPTTPGPTPPASPAGSPAASPSAEPEPSTGPTTEPGPTAAPAGALAVYYLASDKGDPKLVREFHRLPVGDGSPAARTKAAVTEMLDGRTAYDPDYSSLWPASARVRGTSVAGDTVTVDLSGAAVNGAGSLGSVQAVQQLVWTATAASGKPAVRILLDGARVDELWGHVDTRDPLRRANAADTLLPVWLIDPQHGATVGREFTMHLAGMVFEATVNYEIRRGSTVVKRGAVTLSAGRPAQGEAKVPVILEPGTYVIEAFEISANDSSRQHLDNHTITVR
ncbi:GerMN domain-containing protein [Catellatospora sp. KI3]|uniref:GerMN domain-containing protein n=1 Tax=Catellatospora sp. KI3 TaxID=3041620 RepID=UPI002482ED62|nr:GerMN domain-containing protein [Catellatospora sp. KI3]MDI1462273.1 GerMN domain-containing protein [Catellatospora sp. KI3]